VLLPRVLDRFVRPEQPLHQTFRAGVVLGKPNEPGHSLEHGVAGGGGDRHMERAVAPGPFRGIVRRFEPRGRRTDRLKVAPACGETWGIGIATASRASVVPQTLCLTLEECSAADMPCDETLGLEPGQDFAERRPRQPQGLGEFTFGGKARSGLQALTRKPIFNQFSG
jgi:hypothetical protein